MAKAPAFQFYVRDWLTDTELGKCSPATRGIWIDLLANMWVAPERGKLRGTPAALARLCRCFEREMQGALDELHRTAAADVVETEGVYIVSCRRMVAEDKARMAGAKRQARFRERGGGDPENWTAIRATILERDGKMCAYCGRRADTVDHIMPRSKGGTEDSSNLVACCKRCNTKKSDRSLEDAGMSFWEGYDRSNIESDTKVTPTSASASASASAYAQLKRRRVTWDEAEKRFVVPAETMAAWERDFASKDVAGEIRKASAWHAANRRWKSSFDRALVAWLGRADDRPAAQRVQADKLLGDE